MAAILSIIAVIVLASALLFAGDKKPVPIEKKVTTTCTGKEVTAKGIKSMQKCEIEDMLVKLERSAIERKPEDSDPPYRSFDICYVSRPKEETYVSSAIEGPPWPKCWDGNSYTLGRGRYVVSYHLGEAKKLVEEINKLSELSLHVEATSLAPNCKPEEAPWFVKIVTTYADGTINVRIYTSPDELESLLRIFRTVKEHKGDIDALFESERQIRNDIQAARELLGIQPPDKEKKE